MFSIISNYPKVMTQNYTFKTNNISFKSNDLTSDVFQKSKNIDDIVFPEEENPKLNSKTMRRLYSSEFTPTRRRSDYGYYMTTIIDRQTQKPVDAYVMKLTTNQKDTKYIKNESWGIFVKNGKRYERVGLRDFQLDYKNKVIKPGWMDADGNCERYSGIGLRGHQIAIERMMQEGFNTVEIQATAAAFPFHYKSGFRIIPKKIFMPHEEFQNFLSDWCAYGKLSVNDLKSNMVCKVSKNGYTVDNKTIENFRKTAYINGVTPKMLGSTMMSLQGEWLDTWKQMAKCQPILLDEEECK